MLLEQVVGTSCWNKLLEHVVGTNCWNKLLEQVVGTSCCIVVMWIGGGRILILPGKTKQII